VRSAPGPRAHLDGTLALVERFAAVAGGHAELPRLRALLDRPSDLPASVSAEENALKYDAYLAAGADGVAWGVTINDRYEPAALRTALAPVAEAWGADLSKLLPIQAAVADASPILTVAAGFDSVDRPPRLKLYLQEDRWGQGLGDAAAVDALLEPFGVALPAWMARDRRVGVVTIQFRDGVASAKAYLGAQTAAEAAQGSPCETLAARFAALCPLEGWYYLTVRLDPGAEARYAINKIYNPVQIGFDQPRLWSVAWREIRGLFDAAGRGESFAAIDTVARELGREGVAVVPTATAFEDGGRSADLYCAAWRMP
jgi:hypothetical protein